MCLMSCIKEEIPVPKYVLDNAQTKEIPMEQDYRNQLYFDLETNTIVKSNLKTAWDLAFESVDSHVILNTGKGMAVHSTTLPLESITTHENLEWMWDAPSGNLDSTAFGDWENENRGYVIDRGYNWLGQHQGHFKLKILNRNVNGYEISYGSIESTVLMPYFLPISVTEQFTYFSFDTQVVSIAPPENKFDLIFTQYTHLFKNPLTPYLVTGVLLNRNRTQVALYPNDQPFETIKREEVEGLTYDNNINAIGYDWKSYSLEDGVFTTDSEKYYIVKTQEGFYYRFRFIGFYNIEGVKGYPKIEFQVL